MATICRIRLARLEPRLDMWDPVSMELAGIVYTGIQPKVSIELLRRGEPVKGSHFRDQDDGT